MSEVAELRERLRVIRDEALFNQAAFERLLQRELELLNAPTLPQLLTLLTRQLCLADGLAAATLVLDDPQHELRHLLRAAGVGPEGLADVILTDSVLALAPQARTLSRPWLGPYVAADHELLFPGVSGLASVALLPLQRGERLVGTLNLGSTDAGRYTRELGSDFLTHLAAIAGFCIDSCCNRARLVRAGLTDELTGWHNRRYLNARLREELARAQRQGCTLALLMIDVDNLKEINDSCGHLAGDEALREVAARIEAEVRSSDTAARFGGDEFVVLLPSTAPAEACLLAERIRRAVAASPIELEPGRPRAVTLSVGVAGLVPTSRAGDLKALGERLLAEADAALYRAKTAGRDRVELHD
jgi:two-component system, cell cycle response regulator